MALIKTSRIPLEKIKEMLVAGFSLRVIGLESGYSPSVLSIMARAWGLPLRKRGRKAAQ